MHFASILLPVLVTAPGAMAAWYYSSCFECELQYGFTMLLCDCKNIAQQWHTATILLDSCLVNRDGILEVLKSPFLL